MRTQSIASRRGVALLELVTALLILGTVITLALESFVFFHKASRRTDQKLEQLQTANELLRQLRADVMRAQNADVENNLLILRADGNAIVYRFDSREGTVQRQAHARNETIAEGIAALSFDKSPRSSMVHVRLRASGRPGDQVVTAIAMRNFQGGKS